MSVRLDQLTRSIEAIDGGHQPLCLVLCALDVIHFQEDGVDQSRWLPLARHMIISKVIGRSCLITETVDGLTIHELD